MAFTNGKRKQTEERKKRTLKKIVHEEQTDEWMEVAPKDNEAPFEPTMSNSRGRQLLSYANKTYDIGGLLAGIKDARKNPDIPLSLINSTLFISGLLRFSGGQNEIHFAMAWGSIYRLSFEGVEQSRDWSVSRRASLDGRETT